MRLVLVRLRVRRLRLVLLLLRGLGDGRGGGPQQLVHHERTAEGRSPHGHRCSCRRRSTRRCRRGRRRP